jgi:transcription initiation factor TFIIB
MRYKYHVNLFKVPLLKLITNFFKMSDMFCESHPHAQLIDDWHAGDMICSDCGLVVQERVIEVSSEWQILSNKNEFGDNSRINRSALENSIDKLLRDIIDKLSLTKSIFFLAQSYCSKIIIEKLLKGNLLIVATAIYIACRKESTPISYKEIESVCGTDCSFNIKKAYNSLVSFYRKKGFSQIPPITSSQLFIRWCSLLNLSSEIERLAIKISDRALKVVEISGKSPSTIAAVSLYMACQQKGNKLTINCISEVSGVSVCTIKSTIRKLELKL